MVACENCGPILDALNLRNHMIMKTPKSEHPLDNTEKTTCNSTRVKVRNLRLDCPVPRGSHWFGCSSGFRAASGGQYHGV